jgi:hypothetical protein
VLDGSAALLMDAGENAAVTPPLVSS